MSSHDLRFAFRQIHKSPGFAAAVVLTLALGIGLSTSMLDGFLLRTLPYPEVDRIGALVVHREGIDPGTGRAAGEEADNFDGASWQLLKDNVEGVVFAASGGTNGVNLKGAGASGSAVRYVRDSRVSARYFDVLGIPLYLGRSFSEEEDRPNGPSVVVLSYALWQSTFHTDPLILGKPIALKGRPYVVVGVLPRSAITPSQADLFTPLQPATTGECGGQNCRILIRLKPGANWQQVNGELARVRLPSFTELETVYHGRGWVYAQPLRRQLAGEMHDKVAALMLAVLFILLIACSNLAGLALVRISRRTPELAIRMALGASPFKVLRQLWVENLVLALLGGAAALGLAVVVLRTLGGFLPEEMIPLGGFRLDERVLFFALAASLIASLLFGALPAFQTRRLDLRSSIAAGSRTVTGGSARLRQVLIGAEVAITIVLLAAAGLLVRTLVHLETLPPGFDPRNVMTARASLDDARYQNPAAFQSLLQKSTAAMRRIPGVQSAAVGLSVPYEDMLNDYIRVMDGKKAGTGISCSLSYITPDYFSTLRMPLLAGRTFHDSDTSGSQLVAIVNASFGKQFYNDAAPIGRHFKDGDDLYTIVGVVGDIEDQSNVERSAPIGSEPIFYVPATQAPQGLLNLAHIWFQPSWIVRTAGSPAEGTIAAMQHALAEADPDLPFSGFYSMREILNKTLQMQRVEVLLLTTLAGLALLLSAIGIYALVSNLIVERTREIGIRIALGSGIEQAMIHVGSSGLLAAGGGLIAGIALSFLALRALAGEIYGIAIYDPLILVVVPLALALIATAASLLPTLHISRLYPADTLRSE